MPKNIIVCYDGTGNEYGEHNTNVVKMYEVLVRDTGQVTFYDPGVGTFSTFGHTAIAKWISKKLGDAFGFGLDKNIADGYEYLMNRYEPGDKLFIFGFSRGAFTARALAGMIYHFGVLQKGSKNLIPYVIEMYNKMKKEKGTITPGFKKTFCHDCKPHLVGVWDTVGSLGYFFGKKFFDTKLNPDIKFGYQACAIDEKRKKFPISLWDENNEVPDQTIEQVWFAGVHSDIGGSYEDAGLSDITLGWMVDKAFAEGMEVEVNWQAKLKQNCQGELHNSREGFWRFWRKVTRKIPDKSNIHQSVVDRMQKDSTYKPKLPDQTNTVSNKTYDDTVTSP